MATKVVDPETGLEFVVVEPGSPEDPFTARNAAPSPSSDAEPEAKGEPVARSVGEPSSQASAAGVTPAPTSAEGEEDELSPEEQARLETVLDTRLASRIESARREWQSKADKRADDLQKQLDASVVAQKALQDSIREGQLLDLTDDEREALKAKWSLDDRKAELDEYEAAVDEMYKTMYTASILEEYAPYGVTGESLNRFEEPEQMEAWCEAVKTGWEQARTAAGLSTTPAAGMKATTITGAGASGDESVPAGVSAPSDIGGNAPAAPPPELDKTQGLDAMTRNLNNLKWESVKLPA